MNEEEEYNEYYMVGARFATILTELICNKIIADICTGGIVTSDDKELHWFYEGLRDNLILEP